MIIFVGERGNVQPRERRARSDFNFSSFLFPPFSFLVERKNGSEEEWRMVGQDDTAVAEFL